jgi:hypothetical protein
MTAARRGPNHAVLARATSILLAADPDSKTAGTFSMLYMSGWKPDPSQPAPARRESAKVSLAEAGAKG